MFSKNTAGGTTKRAKIKRPGRGKVDTARGIGMETKEDHGDGTVSASTGAGSAESTPTPRANMTLPTPALVIVQSIGTEGLSGPGFKNVGRPGLVDTSDMLTIANGTKWLDGLKEKKGYYRSIFLPHSIQVIERQYVVSLLFHLRQALTPDGVVIISYPSSTRIAKATEMILLHNFQRGPRPSDEKKGKSWDVITANVLKAHECLQSFVHGPNQDTASPDTPLLRSMWSPNEDMLKWLIAAAGFERVVISDKVPCY